MRKVHPLFPHFPNDLRRQFQSISKELREPAGNDTRFNSIEGIKSHFEDFVMAFHKGLNKIHLDAINELIALEQIDRTGWNDSRRFIHRRTELAWRRVTDTIVWNQLNLDRFSVKQLWNNQRRPILTEANPDSIKRVLAKVQEDDLLLATWLDASSFADTGDILVSAPNMGFNLIEVKEDENSDIIFSEVLGSEELRSYRKSLHQQVGQSRGDQRADRLSRQVKRMGQAGEVIRTEEGVDPFLNIYKRAVKPAAKDEKYIGDIKRLIDAARRSEKAYALDLIDDCLWFGVYHQPLSHHPPGFWFSAAATFCGDVTMLHDKADQCKIDSISSIESSAYPIAEPLYTYADFESQDICDLITGDILIYFYLDFDSWAKKFQEFGGLLNLLDKRPNSPDGGYVKLNGKYLQISLEDITLSLGGPSYMRIFGDFDLPSIISEQLCDVEAIKQTAQESNN